MEKKRARSQPKVTLRLRRDLHEVNRTESTHRFILGDAPSRPQRTAVCVRCTDDGMPSSIELERPAHSYFPVYFHVSPSGDVVISDTMGFLHDLARREEVGLNTSAQLDHLLFGRPPGVGLLSALEVVDHGERVYLQSDGERWNIVSRNRYDAFYHNNDVYWRESIDYISTRLQQAVRSLSPKYLLFSGGVDSTLLKTILGSNIELLSGRLPEKEFAEEVEQAARAAAHFDADHRYVDVDHDDFVDYLVEITRRTGLPCPAMQHVLQTRVAAHADGSVCYGELGDGTFGLPLIAAPGLENWVSRTVLEPAAAASRKFSLASTRDQDQCFDQRLEEIYGPTDEAHLRRSRRARQLVQWSPTLKGSDRRWEQFLTYGHLIDFLTVGCVKYVRDFASSQAVTVHTPFTARALIDSFHRCDPATRYRDADQTKPVLKALLSKNLPEYPVNRSKLASGLPRTWYFTEGPLREIFQRFPPPSPMDDAVARAIEKPRWTNSWILWPTLSYSVWYHEWFDSGDVAARPDLVIHRLGEMTEGSSRIAG